jgi:hypothetical protein
MALELFKTGSTFTVRDADLVPGGDPDTVYTLQYFTADDADRLRKQATKQVYNASIQRMEDSFDSLAYALSILDHVLVEWTGVVRDGVPLECILANKRVLPGNRRERMLVLAQENVQVKAAAQAASFRALEAVR